MAANAPGSSSAITITGTSPSTSHSVAPSVTITPQQTGGGILKNGDFETGDLSSWSSSGPNVISSTAHSGKFSAQIGSTSRFTGTATLTQQIHVPATGTTTLSFFYNAHCTDSIRYDFQQAQIRNTAGKRLKNIFNICSNAETWQQSTTDLSVYKGQDIVVFYGDHDDNFPGDPTYLLLDDATVTNQ